MWSVGAGEPLERLGALRTLRTHLVCVRSIGSRWVVTVEDFNNELLVVPSVDVVVVLPRATSLLVRCGSKGELNKAPLQLAVRASNSPGQDPT